MPLDWQRRAAFERRMRGPTFVTLSRLLGRAIVDRSLDVLVDGAARCRATEDDIVFAVQSQGVAGRLRALDLARPGVLHPATSAAIRLEAERIVQRNLRLAEDLDRVARAAERAGLRVVPLKGTSLRLTHYASDPSLRSSADLDLLIEPSEWSAWTELLLGLGYTDRYSDGRHTEFVTPRQAPQAIDGEHPEHPRPIELHDHLAEEALGRTIDITGVYREGLAEARVHGAPLWLPAASTLSLHLVLHAAPAMLDRGMRLAQLLDFQWLADDDATVALLRRHLGQTAWAAVTLGERRLPGLLPARLRHAFDDLAPGALRRAIVAARPGVLQGDPHRLGTLAGAALLGSPSHFARRLAKSLRLRALHAGDPRARQRAPLRALALFVSTALRRDERPGAGPHDDDRAH